MFELYICRIGCFCWNLSRKSYTSTSDLLLFLVFNIVSDQYVTQLAILMISWWQMHSYVFNTPNQKKILHNSGENIFSKLQLCLLFHNIWSLICVFFFLVNSILLVDCLKILPLTLTVFLRIFNTRDIFLDMPIYKGARLLETLRLLVRTINSFSHFSSVL